MHNLTLVTMQESELETVFDFLYSNGCVCVHASLGLKDRIVTASDPSQQLQEVSQPSTGPAVTPQMPSVLVEIAMVSTRGHCTSLNLGMNI